MYPASALAGSLIVCTTAPSTLTVITDVEGAVTAATRRKYVNVAVDPNGIVMNCCASAVSPLAPEGAASNQMPPLAVRAKAPHPDVVHNELPKVDEVEVQFGLPRKSVFASNPPS